MDKIIVVGELTNHQAGFQNWKILNTINRLVSRNGRPNNRTEISFSMDHGDQFRTRKKIECLLSNSRKKRTKIFKICIVVVASLLYMIAHIRTQSNREMIGIIKQRKKLGQQQQQQNQLLNGSSFIFFVDRDPSWL